MFSIVIVLAMMLVCSVSLGIVARRKTEECIPVIFLGTIVLLYVFYCFDCLIAGRIIVYAAFGVIVFAAVFFIASGRFKGKLFDHLCTPGIIFFVVLSVFFICYLSKIKPSVWDELRLWASSPKALFFTEKFQVGEGSLLYSTMQSYPPGMSLLVYFFMAFSGSYFDGAPFIIKCIFMCALVVPCFKNVDLKKWKFIIPSVVVFLLFPALLSINGKLASGDWAYYYLSLFIDPCLGIVMGSALFCALKRPFRRWFDTIYFSLLLFVLPSLKNTGALFASVVFAGALVLYLVEKNNKGLDFVRAFISLACVAISYFSWQLIINTRGTGEFIDFDVAGFTGDKFINVLKGITSWGYLPFLWIAIFFLGVDIFITLFFKDLKKRDAFISIATFVVVCCCFFYGYISHYGVRLSSIHRYTQSFSFAMFVYLFMRCISLIGCKVCETSALSGNKKSIVKVYLVFLAEIAVFLISIFLLMGFKKLQYDNKYSSLCEDYVSEWASCIDLEGYDSKSPAKCYLLLGGDTLSMSQAHETFHNCAIGSSVSIKNIWCDKFYNAAVADVSDDDSELAIAFIDNLREGNYQYVLIAQADEDMSRVFKLIDDEIVLKNGMVLKVVFSDNDRKVGFEIIN